MTGKRIADKDQTTIDFGKGSEGLSVVSYRLKISSSSEESPKEWKPEDHLNITELIPKKKMLELVDDRVKFLRDFEGLDGYSKLFEKITEKNKGVAEFNRGYIQALQDQANWLEEILKKEIKEI